MIQFWLSPVIFIICYFATNIILTTVTYCAIVKVTKQGNNCWHWVYQGPGCQTVDNYDNRFFEISFIDNSKSQVRCNRLHMPDGIGATPMTGVMWHLEKDFLIRRVE